MLADPDWVTEDEADAIFCSRQQGSKTIDWAKVRKEIGLEG